MSDKTDLEVVDGFTPDNGDGSTLDIYKFSDGCEIRIDRGLGGVGITKNGENVVFGIEDWDNNPEIFSQHRKAMAIYNQKCIIEELKEDIENNKIKENKVIETAQKIGYVQGVCESVLAFNTDENRKIMSEATMSFLSKKLLSEMNVTKDMAQKFANPETYKALEKCLFAPAHEQQIEQTQTQGRKM